MATALDYGGLSAHRAQMHPLFIVHRQETPPPPAPTANMGDDGLHVDNDAQEPMKENLFSQECRQPDDAPPQLQPMFTTNELYMNDPWDNISEDALENEHKRIKRRKVSEETKYSSWHEQLQQAADTWVQPKAQLRGSDEGTVNTTARTKAEDASHLHEDPSGHILRSADNPNPPLNPSSITVENDSRTPINAPLLQLDGTMDDPPLKRTKPSSSTPKKNTIRSDHGKTKSSPTSIPRRSPRSVQVQGPKGNHDTKKVAKSSKKVEMKNGKFVSSLRVTLPYSAPDSAARIDGILSATPSIAGTDVRAAHTIPKKSTAQGATHPFFLAKTARKSQQPGANPDGESSSSNVATSQAEMNTKSVTGPPKPWKDIVFGHGKPPKQIAAPFPAVWPPTSLQHVQPHGASRDVPLLPRFPVSHGASKLKKSVSQIGPDEDILQTFAKTLNSDTSSVRITVPSREVMSGKALSTLLDPTLNGNSDVLGGLKTRVETKASSFDRGRAAGSQMWSQEYAPKFWQDVLEAGPSEVLHDWLRGLQVHHVQDGKVKKTKPPTPKKRRRKRKSDALDDFIVESEDDDDGTTTNGKNAILLVGPPGSCKTASVYAVAQQLDFEVFELNPGTRRSAKDIQEKVGDMTQNHLVQQSSLPSRESSVSIDDKAVPFVDKPLPANQKTMANFINSKGRHPKVTEATENKKSSSRTQKQSLILFEEVDVLFDEDRNFWPCVQSLIQTSKRPVILTCNDIDAVPLDELKLFAVLQYHRPDPSIAVRYLQHIAAAEGHLLSTEALRNLYLSKARDLRAAITELNLWCQMTVGSRQGGLDWMLAYDDKRKSGSDGSITRIVSRDTYHTGLDLSPQQVGALEQSIRFAQDSLDIEPLNWVKTDVCTHVKLRSGLGSLDDMLTFADAKSAMDMLDDSVTPLVASALKEMSLSSYVEPLSVRAQIVHLYLENLNTRSFDASKLSMAFDPLLDESRIGLPTAPGRKAPTLDNASSKSIATEVAPYIRAIVAHDRRLEQLREELHGSSQTTTGANKRQRRTRAARAAMEGGEKATTRRDKWFDEDLKWDAVLATGGEWPVAREDEDGSSMVSGLSSQAYTPTPASTPSPSAAADIDTEA